MQKWSIKRRLVQQLVDVMISRKKKQMMFEFWTVSAKLGKIVSTFSANWHYIEDKRNTEKFQFMRWRVFQRRWRRYIGAKGSTLPQRSRLRVRHWLSAHTFLVNHQTQVNRAKNKLYLFLYDYTKMDQFKLKSKRYLDNVKKIIAKFETLHQTAAERFEAVKQGYNEEKQRLMMKMLKPKTKKLRDQIGKITKFQEYNVLARYMRFIQDQHAMQFTMWRRRVAALDLDRLEMKAFRLRISMIKVGRRKRELDDDNPLVAQYGPQVDFLIPCLDPELASQKNISDEALRQRYVRDLDIFNKDIELD